MVNHIINIYDENDNLIPFNKLYIKCEKTPRSSKFCNILYIDDVPIIGYRRNNYKVEFKCTCGNISKCSLKYFLGKKYIQCNKCTANPKKYVNKNIKTVIDHNFDNYDDQFKKKYYERHLHETEFYSYLPHMYSINNKKIDNINNIKYYPHDRANNQALFTSKISFDNGLHKEGLVSIQLKCNICNKIFSSKPFNIRTKNIEDIRCRQCNFWTKTYKIQFYKGTNITYQSKLEKTFLDLCFENNIEVTNGFEIPYYFQNKLRTYIVDFYLPKLKYLVEIKGSNPYFIKDLQSGKIEAKNAYAANFCKENNMHFRFIRDYDLKKFVKNIVNKLQNLLFYNYYKLQDS